MTTMHRLILLLALAIILPGAELAAQDMSGTLMIAPGSRVRLSAPSVGIRDRVALYVEQRDDTLVLRDSDQSAMWSVHLRHVLKLEVSRGARSRLDQAARLAFFGGLVGAAAATFVAAATGDELSPGAKPLLIGAGAGIVAGAAVGGLVFPRRERWREVQTLGRFGYVPLYQPGRYGLALSFAF